MAGITFHKLHSSGNDFLVIFTRDLPVEMNGQLTTGLISSMCNRHTGVGADGIMLVSNDRVIHFDPDGSDSFCINGSLCLARLSGNFPDIPLSFSLADVSVSISLNDELSLLNFRPPMVQIQDMTVAGYAGRFVHAGNPHFFVHGIPETVSDARNKAVTLRNSNIFPDGVNVSFWTHTAQYIQILTYERGVEDFTQCCGSACAAFSAGMQRTGETIFLPPSNIRLSVFLDKTTTSLTVSGKAQYVCQGLYSYLR